MSKVNITLQDILDFFKERKIAQNLDPKVLETIIEKLLKQVETFDPKKLTDIKMLIGVIESSLNIGDKDKKSEIVKFLTGYSLEELDKIVQGKEEPIEQDENKIIPVENSKVVKFVRNLAAMVAASIGVGEDFYKFVDPKSKVGKVLTGIGGVTFGAVTLSTVVTLKLVKFAYKILKAAKNTAAKAMHNKAIKDIAKVQERVGEQKKVLEELSRNGIEALDENAAKLDFIGENGEIKDLTYKMMVDSRESGEPSIEECEDKLSERYDEEAKERDDDLSFISNQDTIILLAEKFGISSEHAFQIIQNVKIDNNNELQLDEEYGVDLSVLSEGEKTTLKRSARRDAKISNVSEVTKRKALECLELVSTENGDILQLKPDIDMEQMRDDDLTYMINMLKDREVGPEYLDRIQKSHKIIDFLADCEKELLNRVAIKANQEMGQSLEKAAEKIKKQRGFVKSAVKMVTGINLRLKAELIVESRTNGHINESIMRNEDAYRKLITLAQERLQTDKQLGKGEENLDKSVGNEIGG